MEEEHHLKRVTWAGWDDQSARLKKYGESLTTGSVGGRDHHWKGGHRRCWSERKTRDTFPLISSRRGLADNGVGPPSPHLFGNKKKEPEEGWGGWIECNQPFGGFTIEEGSVFSFSRFFLYIYFFQQQAKQSSVKVTFNIMKCELLAIDLYGKRLYACDVLFCPPPYLPILLDMQK